MFENPEVSGIWNVGSLTIGHFTRHVAAYPTNTTIPLSLPKVYFHCDLLQWDRPVPGEVNVISRSASALTRSTVMIGKKSVIQPTRLNGYKSIHVYLGVHNLPRYTNWLNASFNTVYSENTCFTRYGSSVLLCSSFCCSQFQ